MISASHNAFADNGIKLFGPDGYKLSDERELEIEALMDEGLQEGLAEPTELGRVARDRRRPGPLCRDRQGHLPAPARPERPARGDRLRQRRGLQGRPDRALRAGRRGDRGRRRPQRLQHQRRVRLDPPRRHDQGGEGIPRRHRHRARRRRRPAGDLRREGPGRRRRPDHGDHRRRLGQARAAERRRRGGDGDVEPRPRAVPAGRAG